MAAMHCPHTQTRRRKTIHLALVKGADTHIIVHTRAHTHTHALTEVAIGLSSSSAEAVVGCSLSTDAHQLIDFIHELKRPLKGITFTTGPADSVSYIMLAGWIHVLFTSILRY